MNNMTQSHKTAIKRKKLSTPMHYLHKNNLLKGNVLDYGSGRGNDAERLAIDCYDPYFQPTMPIGQQYDTITCNYVLNVVTGSEMVAILTKIHQLLTTDGKAYISVRSDLKFTEQPGRGCIQYDVHLTLPLIKQNGNFRMYEMRKTSYN